MVHCPPTSRARRSPTAPTDILSSFLSPVLVRISDFSISPKPILIQVDPQAYLGWSSPQSSGDPGGSVDSGETWTQAMLHNPWIPDNGITSSPSIHPKSLDSMLERHQQEILEDLNSLGRYSRYVQVQQGLYKRLWSICVKIL